MLIVIAVLLSLLLIAVWRLAEEIRIIRSSLMAGLTTVEQRSSPEPQHVAARFEALLDAPAAGWPYAEGTLGASLQRASKDLAIVKRRLLYLKKLYRSVAAMEHRMMGSSSRSSEDADLGFRDDGRLPIDRLESLKAIERETPLSKARAREKDLLEEWVLQDAQNAEEDEYESLLGTRALEQMRRR